MPRAFIIGGTGQIGLATAAELLRHGWQVTLAHTGRREPRNIPPGAGLVIVDRRDTAALATAIGTADLLVDTIAFSGHDARQLLALAPHFGQLCVISTASVYADAEGRSLDTADATGFPQLDAPCPETHATVAPSPDSYSTAKVELEQALLADATRPVTLLRPCAVHGINSRHPREWWFVKRMLDDRKAIPLAGNTGTRFHTSATANIAALLRTAAESPATRILNAGDPDPPTLAHIGEILAAELGWSGEFVSLPSESTIGQTPFSVPSDFTVAMAAAEAIGYRPAGTYRETLRPYLAWMKAHAAAWRETFPVFTHYPANPFDYGAEDKLLR